MNILRLFGQQRSLPWQKTVEPVIQGAGLLLLVGGGLASPPATSGYLFSLCFLIILWISLRHGLPGAIPAMLVVNGAILASGYGFGSQADRQQVDEQVDLLVAWLVLSLATLATAWVVSLNRRTTARLIDHQQRLLRILDALPVLVAYADADERYRFNNLAYQSWFGYTPEAILGKTVRNVVGEAGYSAIQAKIHQALRGQTATLASHMPYETGDQRYVRATYIPDHGANGDVNGFAILVEDLSEQKRLEQQLADALDLNRKILSEAPIGILVYDSQGRCLTVNERAARIVGGTTQQLRQMNFRQIDSWRKYGLVAMAEQVLGGGDVQRRELHVITTFGKELWLDCCIAPLSVNGAPHLLLLIDDVSERKQVEQELARHQAHLETMVQERTAALQSANLQLQQEMAERQRALQALQASEQQFRQLADAMPQLVWTATPDGQVDYVNSLWQMLSGLTLQPDGHWEWEPLVHPDDLPRTREAWQQAVASGEGYEIEHRLQRADGTYHWYLSRCVPVYDEVGAVIKWFGATTDIHAQKEAEEAIRRRGQEFLALVENAPDPVGRFDREFRHAYVNPAVTRLTGLPAGRFIGRTNGELGMSDAERWNACLARVFATGEEVTQEFQLGLSKGLYIFETRFVPEFGAGGEVETVLSLSRDVTARVQAERALRESEERFRLIAEAIPVPFAIVRYSDGVILFANRQFGLTHGVSVEEVVGQSTLFLFDSPEELPRLLETVERDGAIHNCEIRAKRWCDGNPFWALVSVERLPYEGEMALFMAFQDITERKEANEAVRRSEALLQKVLETIPVGVWLLDATGRVVHGNPAGQRIWGGARYVGLEQLGEYKAWWVDTGRPVAVTEWAGARAVLYGESSQDEELEIECFDGAHKFIHQWAEPLHDDAGALLGAVVVNYDITEQRKAQEQIQYQATLLNNVSDAIVATDLDFHITAWNPAAEALYGWRADEVMGQISTQVVQTTLTPVELKQIMQQIRSEGVWRGEITHHDRDGRPLLVLASLSLVRDSTGQPVGVVAVNRDITASKEAEAQLRILWRAMEQSPALITLIDAEGRIEYVNPTFVRMTGYTLEDVLGKRPRILNDDAEQPEIYRHLRQTIQTGGEWRGELRSITKTGVPYWMSGAVVPVVDSHGCVTHSIALMEDVTERKQREQEREAMLAVATALRAANDRDEMISVILQQVSLSLEATKSFFTTQDSATGELLIEAVYDQGELVRNPNIRLAPGSGVSGHVCRTGQPYVTDDAWHDPVLIHVELLDDEQALVCVPLITQERIIGTLVVARRSPFSHNDVRVLVAMADMAATGLQRAALHEQTVQHAVHLEEQVAVRTRELAEANERLLELDRLKSKFVSNVTHELRTPVTNLSLYLKLLGRKPEKQEQYMMVLHEQTERLRTLVNDVLELSRLDQQRETLNLAPVELNELVQSVVAAHEARAEMLNLALVFEPASDLPFVQGDRDKLIQVMTNLVANALNYTPAGRVVVRTCWDPDKRVILAAIQDTGCGIHAEDIPHLFDRFYRGKRDQIPPVPGTGLGLSIVKELVELHGGTITVASEVGVGSTFMVSLPAL